MNSLPPSQVRDPTAEKRVRDRLRRAEGQVRGVVKMIEDDRSCEDIVTQLMATRRALDEVIRLVVTERVGECLRTLPPDEAEAAIARAMVLLVRA